MRVLLVEDDDAIALPLTQGLVRSGYIVDRVRTVAGALEADLPDVLLLDLGLPDGDGLDVARSVRARSAVPILILSARGEELDRVVGLEVGADDYLVKPFGMRELIARIRAVQRRVAPRGAAVATDLADEVTTVGALVVDRRQHRVTVDGVEVELTPTEFELLSYLAEDPGAVHRRDAILQAVWDHDWYGPTRTLDVHVGSLRRKLGDRRWIETVRGVGYRLVEPRDDGPAT